MPIRHTDKGWFWGSKGPFKTKKKAGEVAGAAFASGYKKMTKAVTIKAPNDYSVSNKPWIFLAGSIEMGKAEPWQEKISNRLEDYDLTILNPRRDDWDPSWVQSKDNPQFRQQVEWELSAQEKADLILCYFDPATKSPITLLELGLFKDKMIVCVPEGFWKKGNVDIVCKRYKVPQVSSIDDLIKAAQRKSTAVKEMQKAFELWKQVRKGASNV